MPGWFRNIDGARKWATALIVGVGMLGFLAILADFVELARVSDYRSGTGYFQDVVHIENRRQTLGALYALLYLAAGIAFIVWLHAAYHNIAAMGARNLRRGFGWAIGAWLVPIISLIWPKQIVNDTWRGSEPSLSPEPSDSWKRVRVPAFVHWWWACYLASGLGFFFFDEGVRDLDRLEVALKINIAGSILTLVAAWLAIKVLTDISRRQNERRTIVGAVNPQMPYTPAPAQWGATFDAGSEPSNLPPPPPPPQR